jgi:hypothetical protein
MAGRGELDIEAIGREESNAAEKTYESTILPASAVDFDPEPHKRLFRQFANPAPLGLCGFALTTFVLSLINVQARSVTTPNIVIGLGTYSYSNNSNLSLRLWRPCPIHGWHVGVRLWKYLWSIGFYVLRRVLD